MGLEFFKADTGGGLLRGWRVGWQSLTDLRVRVGVLEDWMPGSGVGLGELGLGSGLDAWQWGWAAEGLD